MTENINGHDGPPQDLFASAERTQIAQLALGQATGPEATLYVEAVVSLIWPYSNKHNLLSLLLAEPDVRLRSAKGQLKVTFHGCGAREVARSQVGIGDIVRLRLQDAKWTDTGDAVLTPGRKVDWDLHFKNRIILDVRRNGDRLATIDYEGTDTPPPTTKAALNGAVRSVQVNGYQDDFSIVFSTPASTKRISSGSFIDASLDPFADDDGFVLGKGRKRTKFGRTSGSWRLVDDEKSGEHEEELELTSEDNIAQNLQEQILSPLAGTSVLPDVIVLDDNSSPETSPVQARMPPPLMPFPRPPEKLREVLPETENVRTPKLHPLASPGLPMVSPLVKAGGSFADYFAIHPPASSELDAISGSTPEIPSETLPDSASDEDFDGNPPNPHNTTIQAQPPAFDKPAVISPFGSSSGGFAGFGTSFGTSTGFASFSSSFDFGLSRTIGTGVGFGFHVPTTDTSATPAAGDQEETRPQDEFDNNLAKQQNQGMEAAVNEQPIQSPIVQNDLETFRRERSQSEDDDMYGPAQSLRRSPSVASMASGRPGSTHENWQDRFDVTAVDVESDNGPSPPSPFSQNWNDEKQGDRRWSRQSPFVDDASDEVSERGEDVRTSPELVLSQTPSDEVGTAGSINQTDIEVARPAPELALATAPTFETVTKVQIAVGPMLELEGRPDIHTQTEELQRPTINSDNGDSEQSMTVAHVPEELEAGPPEESVTSGELAVHDAVGEEFNLPMVAHEQLLTPDNTQQDAQDVSSYEVPQMIPSLQMPPTPDNTQEPAYANLLYLDGTNDFRPSVQDKNITEISLFAPEQAGTASSRAGLDVQAVSSPYFTARRSTRLSSEGQLANAENVQAEENVDQLKLTRDFVTDEVSEEHQSSGALSPRHDKVLHNMLGMATPLSYYTALPNLSEHFNQQIDVLAICTANSGTPTRSKAGPKDYSITLHLADSFLYGSTTITAQLFRPYKTALPVVQRGEVILLRSFKVQSQKRKMMLLSTDSSAWVVFSLPGVPAKDAEYWDLQIDVPGPQVEYGAEEHVYAKRLMEWWEANGRNAHPDQLSKNGDKIAQGSTEVATTHAPATSDAAEASSKGVTNEHPDVHPSGIEPIEPPRTARSFRVANSHTDNMEKHDHAREKSTALSPTFEPTSPTTHPLPQGKTNGTGNNGKGNEPLEFNHTHPTSPVRTTRSLRRAANRTDQTANEDDPTTADTIEPLPELSSPKTNRRTRRSNSVLSSPSEFSRSLRSQSTVHELRNGTKYIDGHVPTKRDSVHELRDGTKYVDENVSPAVRTTSLREESVVHELRDGTNYVDTSKSPEVRRSARNRRGGSVVHELRDGAKYTDE